MTSTPDLTRPETAPSHGPYRLFTSLIGLTSLLVLLQGLFAGIFLRHDGARDSGKDWIDAHGIGADVATLLALVAVVVAVVKLRRQRALVGGSVALLLLLVAESALGRLIRDHGKDDLTAVHVPLALVIMGLLVWLSLKAVQLRQGNG